jgi:hypothetical protein
MQQISWQVKQRVHHSAARFGVLLALAVLGAQACARPPQVEVQIGLCAQPAAAVRALSLRPRDEPLQVWLFDDPDLTVFARGLRFRLRVSGVDSELTLKVANRSCDEAIPAHDGKCEYDMHGDAVTGAVSLTRALDAAQTRDLLSGRLPLADAMSPAQIAYLRDIVKAWPMTEKVRPLGPIGVQRYHGKPFGTSYDVDISTLPGGARYVEISRRGPVADAQRLRAKLQADLVRAGVAACEDQSAQAANKLRALLATSPG